jgi:hypothetical protein
MRLIRVDLPLPFGPNNPRNDVMEVKLSLSTAVRFWYFLVRLLHLIRNGLGLVVFRKIFDSSVYFC